MGDSPCLDSLRELQPHSLGMTEIQHIAKVAREYLASPEKVGNILGTKLGAILFQLPPKAAFNLTVAESFCTMFREQHSGPTVP
jgi:uncharacterized protein YecE (DUF72 family)